MQLFIFTGVPAVQNPAIALIVLLTVAGNYALMQHIRKKQQSDRRDASMLDRKLNYLFKISKAESCARDIRIFGMNEWILRKLWGVTEQRLSFYRRAAARESSQQIFEAFSLLLRDGIAYAILIVRAATGTLSPQEFVLYIGAVSQLSASVINIIKQYNKLCEQNLQLEDMQGFLDPEAPAAVPMRSFPSAASPYTITFENVSFRYSEESPWILQDIRFSLHSGEKLALIGLNGAGKSTLCNLLCGLLKPTVGQITLNGYSLEEYGDCTDFFAAVFQDIRLLPATVAENISCQPLEQTDIARAWSCIRSANLAQKIESLPLQLNTLLVPAVHEDGVSLSGGEMQRLALARALYHEAPVLLLDEPTAALDPVAENNLYRQYKRLANEKAILFVTHRLASTQFCDTILVLSDGRILQQGTHDELLLQDGLYAEMFRTQSRYYQEEASS